MDRQSRHNTNIGYSELRRISLKLLFGAWRSVGVSTPDTNSPFLGKSEYLFDLPDEAFRAADSEVSLMLAYTARSYAFSVDTEFVSDRSYFSRITGEQEVIPSYSLVNATASYKMTEQSRVHVTAKNIFDKEYFAPTFSNREQATPTRGREVWLSYSYLW